MSIGENNETWSGTAAELSGDVVIGYRYRKYSYDEHVVRRILSVFSIDYIKRNK